MTKYKNSNTQQVEFSRLCKVTKANKVSSTHSRISWCTTVAKIALSPIERKMHICQLKVKNALTVICPVSGVKISFYFLLETRLWIRTQPSFYLTAAAACAQNLIFTLKNYFQSSTMRSLMYKSPDSRTLF